MKIRSLFMIVIFAGILAILTSNTGNSVAQLNLTSLTPPTLTNLTGIADGNVTSSNSSNTSDSEDSESEDSESEDSESEDSESEDSESEDSSGD
jgi:hypothetical protein